MPPLEIQSMSEQTEKRAYEAPTLEERDQLTDVTEGNVPVSV
jgi:hypothetical protein